MNTSDMFEDDSDDIPKRETDPDMEALQAMMDLCVEDLNTEYARAARDIVHWNVKLADATHDAMVAEINLKRAKAYAFVDLKGSALDAKGKPVSIEEAKQRVDLDEDVIEAGFAYARAYALKVKMRGMADAALAKRDMIQSLGAKLRAELRAD